MLFNIWEDGDYSKTTVIADDMNEALDRFCVRHGFVDHADYCQFKQITESNLNIQAVDSL